MSDVIVHFESVDKDFKSLHALRGISFEIKQGEVLGFIGPNGCGKTTTARLILGFYRPTKGIVRVFGKNPVSDFGDIGSRVGVMLEQPGIHERLTANEYLEYFGGLLRMSRENVKPRARQLLSLVGLSDRANSYLGTFSKGMRQRVSLARCLLNHPRLVILDEPFDGLDIESRRIILDIMPVVAKEQGTSVFVTSHNLAEVEEISHRVAIIKHGTILALDDVISLKRCVPRRHVLIVNLARDYPKELIAQVASDAEYAPHTRDLIFNLDSTSGTHDELLMRLLRAGISINSVGGDSTSLEDVYFALTKTPTQ